MNPKIYKIGIPAGIAVLAITIVASFGAHQMALGQGGFYMHHGGQGGFHGKMMNDIPEFTGTIPVKESIRENIDSVKIDVLEAGTIAAKSVEEGKVLGGGIMPTHGYLTYFFMVVSTTEDNLHKILVDAGSGEILYTSDGISLEELDAKMAEMKEKFGKDGFQYGKHPMGGWK